jgi:hypothetical protein
MGEKRKPEFTLLLKFHSKNKTHKVELFPDRKWAEFKKRIWGTGRFRVRVDGKWFPPGKKEYYTKTQVKELVFKTIRSDYE